MKRLLAVATLTTLVALAPTHAFAGSLDTDYTSPVLSTNASAVSDTQLFTVSTYQYTPITINTYQYANLLVPTPHVEYKLFDNFGRLLASKVATGSGSFVINFAVSPTTVTSYSIKARSLDPYAVKISYSYTY